MPQEQQDLWFRVVTDIAGLLDRTGIVTGTEIVETFEQLRSTLADPSSTAINVADAWSDMVRSVVTSVHPAVQVVNLGADALALIGSYNVPDLQTAWENMFNRHRSEFRTLGAIADRTGGPEARDAVLFDILYMDAAMYPDFFEGFTGVSFGTFSQIKSELYDWMRAENLLQDIRSGRASEQALSYDDWVEIYQREQRRLDEHLGTSGWDDHARALMDRLVELKNGFGDYADRYAMANSGGICPTFIQPAPGKAVSRQVSPQTDSTLFAAIAIPDDYCLLRSDIPIYGVAGGSDFERYVVEYGVGAEPEDWFTIVESTIPKNTFHPSQVPSLLQGDLDLRGNLATWNTGLKNWEHLPWHPALDTTDLNGVYTIRLTVFGRNGSTVRDRVVGEVGRAIAQCLPGIAISADSNVVMRFPEQALEQPFRVYAIQPVAEYPALPGSVKLLGQVYRIREGGDRFIKPVHLEMTVRELGIGNNTTRAIAAYDYDRNAWVELPSDIDHKTSKLRTTICALPNPNAFVAVLEAASGTLPIVSEFIFAQERGRTSPSMSVPLSGSVLVYNDFESDMGQWTERDRHAGANLALDCAGRNDSGCYLKLSPRGPHGNFACTILDSPFDVREYQFVEFDYRALGGMMVDLYANVEGRWYCIGFTDEPNEFAYKDVNIASVGQIADIQSDGDWHRASFNLREMLLTRTRNTIVSQLILANWDVGGFMNLSFGHTPPEAELGIDDFTIFRMTNSSERKTEGGDQVELSDFDGGLALTHPHGGGVVFADPVGSSCEARIVREEDLGGPEGTDMALRIDYDIEGQGQYAGWWMPIHRQPPPEANLCFDIKATTVSANCLVGIKGASGEEVKIPLSYWLQYSVGNEWQRVAIPLWGFGRLPYATALENLSLSFSEKTKSRKGSVYVDDIAWEKRSDEARPFRILDFEDNSPALNAFGGTWWAFENGAATVNAALETRPTHALGHRSLRIAYGGAIGLDLGAEGFSFGGWATSLNGVDCRRFDSLAITVRGMQGGETVNVYLDDGNERWPVALGDFQTIDTTWNRISIPMERFLAKRIDLSCLEKLEIVFEWNEMSGVIWIDDIEFVPSGNPRVTTAVAEKADQ